MAINMHTQQACDFINYLVDKGWTPPQRGSGNFGMSAQGNQRKQRKKRKLGGRATKDTSTVSTAPKLTKAGVPFKPRGRKPGSRNQAPATLG